MSKQKDAPMQAARQEQCPKCGLKGYYYHRRTHEFACRKCGTTWPAPGPQKP